MKPLQCFFYPRGAAHIISQLELRIQQLEAELDKPEAQLRRLQNARSPQKEVQESILRRLQNTRPSQKELQESIKEFIQKECTFSNGARASLSSLYKAYCRHHKESPAPEIGLFSLALRSIAQELPLQYGRTATGYTCKGISLPSEADLPAPHPQGQNSRPAAHPAHVVILDEVQDPDRDPYEVIEPKLSDAIFPKGATRTPLPISDDFAQNSSEADLPTPGTAGTSSLVPHPEEADEHDQAIEEWLTRLPKHKVNPDDWKLQGSWNVTPPSEEPRATGNASAPAEDDDEDGRFALWSGPFPLPSPSSLLSPSAEGGTPNSSEADLQPEGQTSNSEGASSK